MFALILVALFITLYPALSRPDVIYYHPIDMLIHQAKSQHAYYESHAT
jgi:hypothetical protein